MLKSMRLASLSLVLVQLAVTGEMAQPGGCFIGDDGFNLGCCTTPQVNLPFFPATQTSGLWGCFQDCNFQNDYQVVVQMGAPIFVLCDYALIPITVMPAAAGITYSNGLELRFGF